MMILSFVALSCISDSDSNDNTKDMLVGTWQPVTIRVYGTYNGQKIDQTQALSSCIQQSRSTYRADGTATDIAYSDQNGPCALQGQTNYTYVYNAGSKTITETAGNTSHTIQVKSISTSQLVITMQLSENGVNYTADTTMNKVN